MNDEPELPPIPDDLSGGKPRIDATIVGNITADTVTSPKDDMYTWANKDRLLSMELPEGAETLESDHSKEAREMLLAALSGDDLSEHDARQAQLLFRAFTDTKAREKAGCSHAKKVIDDIRPFRISRSLTLSCSIRSEAQAFPRSLKSAMPRTRSRASACVPSRTPS